MPPSNTNTPLLKEIAKKQLEQALVVSKLKNDVDGLKKGMQRILFLLDNDNRTGTKGVVEQVRILDRRSDKLERFRDDLKIQIGTLGFIAGLIGSFIPWLLKTIFNK